MKWLLSINLLLWSISLAFGQEKYSLIFGEQADIEQLQIKENKLLLSGTDKDGLVVAIIKTNSKKWNKKTTPFEMEYNVVCKIVEQNVEIEVTLIQYNTHITKFNVQQVPQLQNAHYNYIKQLKNIGSVLVEGRFFNDDGGFILVEGSISNEVINADPTIHSGFIIPEIQKIKLLNVLCE